MLFPLEAKLARLKAAGISDVVVQPFDLPFAALAAEAFVPHLLKYLPRLKALYVGANFRYGQGRKGDVSALVQQATKAGLHVTHAPRLHHDGEPISSTRIRQLVSAGQMPQAEALLGYPYESTHRRLRGQALGRTIGFPTINLAWSPQCQPRYGVYTVSLSIAEGPWCPAVANYGKRPTVAATAAPSPLLEVHALGSSVSCPVGESVSVRWHQFIRPEQRFENVESLKAQMQRDKAQSEAFFGPRPHRHSLRR
jgi:riboflavin kinase/FMN adenylyltransferase